MTLREHGADEVILDASGKLTGRPDVPHADKLLELVGPATLRDSLRLLALFAQ